jgi:hypothetical protein
MKGKKDTYLLRSEVQNVEMKSRREDTARRKEEKGGRLEKLSLFQVRRIGCSSRLRWGPEDE